MLSLLYIYKGQIHSGKVHVESCSINHVYYLNFESVTKTAIIHVLCKLHGIEKLRSRSNHIINRKNIQSIYGFIYSYILRHIFSNDVCSICTEISIIYYGKGGIYIFQIIFPESRVIIWINTYLFYILRHIFDKYSCYLNSFKLYIIKYVLRTIIFLNNILI